MIKRSDPQLGSHAREQSMMLLLHNLRATCSTLGRRRRG